MSDGKDCRCHAHCEHECSCDADWTPKEVYDLRAELAQRTAERDAREVELTALKNAKSLAEMWRELDTINSVVSQRDEAIAERDEARREICNGVARRNLPSDFDRMRLRYAAERGWDCFDAKEGKP